MQKKHPLIGWIVVLSTCWIVGFYILSPLFSACSRKNEYAISAENLIKLKSKYSTETINYFYETVFHEDFNKANFNNLRKWKSNPKIVPVGNPSATELGYVKNAISRINKLNLPIKCTLENKSDTNSIELFFGNVKELRAYLKADSLIQMDIDTTNHFGLARSVSYDGILSKVYIGICYNEKDTLQSTRKDIVLEEIIQSLGIIGDSYSYPSSLFFENRNPAKSFTKLDKEVLLLLYEAAIPVNYARKSFEKDFADVLYQVNTSKKIKDYLKKFPKDLYMSDEVEACFTLGELLKHPKEIGVHLYGSIHKEDWVIVKRAIASINKIAPNLNLSLAQPSTPEPAHGIVLNFQEVDQQKESIRRTIDVLKGKNCMLAKLIKSKVCLSFNGSENSRKFRQQSIVDALYFSLVQIPQNRLGKTKLFEIRDDTIDFDKRYAHLLKLIYSNELVDGLKLSDFREIKASMAK